jgi:16S rRNA (adenine1518-N6/adenine1519-N6)-dimethyltransferase
MKVPASAFRPAPKVDSAILVVKDVSQGLFEGDSIEARLDVKHFFSIVRAGFAHKRKLLIRNLESVAGKEVISKAFEESSIPLSARAEDVPLETWFSLARAL